MKNIILYSCLVFVLPLTACGLGAGKTSSDVQLSVTRDFGGHSLRDVRAPKQAGEETVMRLLQRNAKVETRYGGKFVQSISGLAGGRQAGRSFDWLYYVNGVEAAKGAAEVKVHSGDRVWWDYHDWGAAQRIPAVVGSFPEPLRSGLNGKRLPVRIECSKPQDPLCRKVADKLAALNIPTAQGTVASGLREATIRLLIGPWSELKKHDDLVASLADGPAKNGVYVRFKPQGNAFELLTQAGQTATVAGVGSGLIAATMREHEAPVWLITGTDQTGVGRAVQAFDERTLRHAFALALVPKPVHLPVQVKLN